MVRVVSWHHERIPPVDTQIPNGAWRPAGDGGEAATHRLNENKPEHVYLRGEQKRLRLAIAIENAIGVHGPEEADLGAVGHRSQPPQFWAVTDHREPRSGPMLPEYLHQELKALSSDGPRDGEEVHCGA